MFFDALIDAVLERCPEAEVTIRSGFDTGNDRRITAKVWNDSRQRFWAIEEVVTAERRADFVDPAGEGRALGLHLGDQLARVNRAAGEPAKPEC